MYLYYIYCVLQYIHACSNAPLKAFTENVITEPLFMIAKHCTLPAEPYSAGTHI